MFIGGDPSSKGGGSFLVSLHGVGKNIFSMLMCNIRRSDTGTDDTWAGTASGQLPLLLEVDIHHESEAIGSRQRTAK